MFRYYILSLLLLSSSLGFSQGIRASSGEIYKQMQSFANTKTVMYLAAHPDDENTRLISYLSNHENVNTVYLSLTRGDGGQNLIGTETGPLLGLLRTQELLEARKVDGGKQWFTRANDFGYSKTADETLEIWDKEKILGDVVWAIRLHQPDVLINRFDHNSNGRTHGHHTSSAVLGVEAFDLAADPTAYPEQLAYVDPWQVKRLYHNTSWFFYGSREAFEKVDKKNMAEIDVGVYYPILGVSNNEIASWSRSKHRCQGFGSAAARGSQIEYLLQLKGDAPTDKNDILSGIDDNWRELSGRNFQTRVKSLLANYDFTNSANSTEAIQHIWQDFLQVQNVQNGSKLSYFVNRKREEVEQLLIAAAGIYAEARTSEPSGISGQSIPYTIELLSRNLDGVEFENEDGYSALPVNQRVVLDKSLQLSESSESSNPYWLNKKKNGELYHVDNPLDIGKPQANNLETEVNLLIDGIPFSISLPIQFKRVEPDFGEIYQPFRVVPPVSVSLDAPIYMSDGSKAMTVQVKVKTYAPNQKGILELQLPKNWQTVSPQLVDIAQSGDEQWYSFVIQPKNKKAESGLVSAAVIIDGQRYENKVVEIQYDHIESQIVIEKASSNLEVLDIKIPDIKVAYVQGAGDQVANSLRSIGMDVTDVPVSSLRGDLSGYDAIVLGIRAFNTQDDLKFVSQNLWDYAETGGNVLVQYNTSRRLPEIAPISLTLGRDRITEEDAKLSFVNEKHVVLNYPNKITQADFDDWVQERGLYFASDWHESFQPILSGNDKGEDKKEGMLLVAKYGDGYYTYSGLSFFRELPAGVPGAYRLLVNILALDQIDN